MTKESNLKLLNYSALLFLLLFFNCNSEENVTGQNILSPPDINWIQVGLDTCRVYSIFFPDDENIFAGTDNGLYKSSDIGVSWIHINIDSTKSAVTNFSGHPDGSFLLCTTVKGVFKSTEAGANWDYIGLRNVAATCLAVDSEGKIFAGTRGSGIYSSDLPYDEWFPVNSDFNLQTFSALLINSGGSVFAGGTGVYKSDNGGRTWSLKNDGLGNWSVYSLVEGKAGEIFAGADVGGFFKSTDDGENWIRSNNGMINTEITSLAINQGGNIFSGTWRGGVYRSTNNGNEWALVDSGLTNKSIYAVAVSPDDYLYAGTFRGIFRSGSKTAVSASKISGAKY